MDFHLKTVTETEAELKTSSKGLQSSEISEREEKFGKNQLEVTEKKTVWKMIFSQFADFMFLVLMAAAVISVLVGDLTDSFVILGIALINITISVIQEWRSEKAMEALGKMAAGKAKVLRDNNKIEIPSSDLVPGDLVYLDAGDVIPADIRFTQVFTLKVDESSLTGESANIEKIAKHLDKGDYQLGDRINLGYKGSSVTNGHAEGLVVATGMDTELGRIAKMIQKEEIKTPLQKRLTTFGKQLTIAILVLCVVFFLVGYLRGESWSTMLLAAISLAVAAIPEAMPALVTISLALGAKLLVKNNALIRKLPAVETLGSVTYICTDKTGTLTLNKMTVEEVFEVNPDGMSKDLFPGENILLNAIGLSHDVSKDKNNNWVGESTEVALARYASEKKYDRPALESKYPRIEELPFDSTRKCMTTIHKTNTGYVAFVKGGVDVLFGKLTAAQQSSIPSLEEKVNEMAAKGYRTLGYAYRFFAEMPEQITPEFIETDLTFAGITGMIDPPREEARAAVAECKAAGIISVMITGDHKLTAKAIAKDLGIISSEEDMVMEGHELKKLSDENFAAVVEKIKVYARVDPEQKLKIINALQAKNHFVAMTGDGVNDAPALKNADIGIAMGINGTEVSKEASHMILLDDNFATIVKAVKHGRRIFDNILKFIKYIMTGNAGEIWALFLAPVFGLPIPLLAIHILWINLVTDGLPGLALAYEPAEENIMQRPPRKPGENIFAKGMGWHIVLVGLLMGGITLGIQAWSIHTSNSHWQTMAFTVLCFSQLGLVVGLRSETRSVFKTGLMTNKPLLISLVITIALQLMIIYTPFFNKIFKTQPLTAFELMIALGASSIVFWVVEIKKMVSKR